MKKGAIELSMNFLVIIIISIIIFGYGIYILNRFFFAAEGETLLWEDRMKDELRQILDNGALVAIPLDTQPIANKELGKFGVGVRNILDISPANFKVRVEFSKAFLGNNVLCVKNGLGPQNPVNCGNPDSWLVPSPYSQQKEILKHDQGYYLVGVDVDGATSKATYIFDVIVEVQQDPSNLPSWQDIDHDSIKEEWEQYQNLQKLMVNVP